VPAALRDRPYYVGNVYPYLMLGALVHTSTVVMRRSLLREVEGCDPAYRICEDYEMYVRAAKRAPFAMIDAPSLMYRVGDADQMTAPKWILDIARANLQVFEQHSPDVRKLGVVPEELLATRLVELHGWIGIAASYNGARDESRRHLRRALRMRPLQPSIALHLLLGYVPPRAAGRLRRLRRRLIGQGTK
jgi:hypothetical protein